MGFSFCLFMKILFAEALNMQNYKEVCGGKEAVWFEINSNEGKKFLKWAKDLGCVWISGKEIEPQNGADFLHFSMRSDGTLAYVDMLVWFSNAPKYEDVERFVFGEYLKGIKVCPKSRMGVIHCNLMKEVENYK